MSQKPGSTPNGCQELYQRNYPFRLPDITSVVLTVASIWIVNPGLLADLMGDRSSVARYILSEQGGVIIILGVAISIVLMEVHEQSHRLSAKVMGLNPTYRRLKSYVLIQETWITKREHNWMTAAPLLTIQVPSLLTVFVAGGLLQTAAEIAFVINGSLMAKDILDICYTALLPRETWFWVSDLGDGAVEYYTHQGGST